MADNEKTAADALNEEFEANQAQAASDAEAVHENGSQGETEEEYYERIAKVPGIFGDTDTTAGAGAAGVDVVSAKNEQATVAVAEADAAAEEGDEEAADASTDEARRQVDVELGTTASAEEVDEAADDDDDSDDEDDNA